MRKRYKTKKRSCPMCKPHKMNGAKRWSLKVLDFIIRTDKEISENGK